MKKKEAENKLKLKISLEEIFEGEMVENINLFEMGETTSEKKGIERIFHDLVRSFENWLKFELDFVLFPEDSREKGDVREE